MENNYRSISTPLTLLTTLPYSTWFSSCQSDIRRNLVTTSEIGFSYFCFSFIIRSGLVQIYSLISVFQ